MTAIREALVPLLEKLVPKRAVQSIVTTLPRQSDAVVGTLDIIATRELVAQIEVGLRTFGGRLGTGDHELLRKGITGGRAPNASTKTVTIASDHDVLVAQRTAMAMVKGFFGGTDCVRLTTVVSELSRNMYMYAGGGELKLSLAEENGKVMLEVLANDTGPGIPHLEVVLSGGYVSKTGLGRGILGAKRIFDQFEIKSTPGVGTRVRGVKWAKA
jgi:serine/threonine-protein kinase RsbT